MSNPYFDPSKYKLGHEFPDDVERSKLLREQQESWGFDETQLYSLDDTTLRFLIPRLILLKNIPGLTDETNARITEMIECFQYVLDNLYPYVLDNLYPYDSETFERFEKMSMRGFYLLGESMGALWF